MSLSDLIEIKWGKSNGFGRKDVKFCFWYVEFKMLRLVFWGKWVEGIRDSFSGDGGKNIAL